MLGEVLFQCLKWGGPLELSSLKKGPFMGCFLRLWDCPAVLTKMIPFTWRYMERIEHYNSERVNAWSECMVAALETRSSPPSSPARAAKQQSYTDARLSTYSFVRFSVRSWLKLLKRLNDSTRIQRLTCHTDKNTPSEHDFTVASFLTHHR